MCSAGFARTLNARERERSGLSVWYVQSRICSHAQRKRASGEVWSGQVSIICAKQDLLAHSAQESSARGRVRSVSSEKEIACARGHSHTQHERAREVGPYHQRKKLRVREVARTLSARGRKLSTREQRKRSGSEREVACASTCTLSARDHKRSGPVHII